MQPLSCSSNSRLTVLYARLPLSPTVLYECIAQTGQQIHALLSCLIPSKSPPNTPKNRVPQSSTNTKLICKYIYIKYTHSQTHKYAHTSTHKPTAMDLPSQPPPPPLPPQAIPAAAASAAAAASLGINTVTSLKYSNTAMGCPTTQKISQKTRLPCQRGRFSNMSVPKIAGI